MRNVFNFYDQLSGQQREWVKQVEEKYGDNRWWESDDHLIVIEHQSKETMLMMSFPEYQAALESLLERSVCHLDFAYNNDVLSNEIDLALKRKRSGIKQSGEQVEQTRKDYVKRVEDIVESFPEDKIMRIDTQTKPDRNSDGIDISGYDGWLS